METPPTVPSLTRKILIDRDWQNTMEADNVLYEKYAQKLQLIFAAPDRYKWVYSKKSAAFARFREALENTGMPPDLVRVISYTAALDGYGNNRDWGMGVNSDEDEVCGRGPLNLTYAQGYRLGLTNLQLDALVERQVAESNDLEQLKQELTSTANRIDAPATFDEDLIDSAGANLQGGMECIYIKGDDDRTNVKELANAIQSKLGASVSRGLPRETEAYWIAARLARLYAMDFKLGYDELKFDARQNPSTSMELSGIKKGRTEYAITEAAGVIARAAAVPCMAKLDKEIENAPPAFMGELPNFGSCAMLRINVEYDRL